MTRILCFTRYERLGASSRLRFLQYTHLLESLGLDLQISPLITDQMLTEKYEGRRYSPFKLIGRYINRIFVLITAKKTQLLWVEKELLPWFPAWAELALSLRFSFVLDYDDAVFHTYDQHQNKWIALVFSRRIDKLMKNAALVVAGNEYLAARARAAGARKVALIPTSIDLNRYAPSFLDQPSYRAGNDPLRIVWIGSPSTQHYLNVIRRPLQELAKRHSFILRLIGATEFIAPGIRVEFIEWLESTEVENILSSDIGIMPLENSDWERGKCGYKLIQYMACGLPTVASYIGVNEEIVRHEECGLLVRTEAEWLFALDRLLSDQALRFEMGTNGRRRVEMNYCIQKTGPQLGELLRSAALEN